MNKWQKRFVAYSIFSPIILSLLFLAKPTPNIHSGSKRLEIKVNMHILEKALETYSDQNNGLYPINVATLINHAERHQYWKPLQNPFTSEKSSKQVISFDEATDETFAYLYNQTKSKTRTIKRPDLKGYLVYAPEVTSEITSYYIYGIGKDGRFIAAGNRILYLYNW